MQQKDNITGQHDKTEAAQNNLGMYDNQKHATVYCAGRWRYTCLCMHITNI